MAVISIIIPIYNAEKYLHECIDSAIKQTFDDIEIILVDDGATDNSPRICDEYARIDERIRVIHKANGGVCDARNIGMAAVTTEYFCFLESDDWLPVDACEKMYKQAIANHADFIFGAYYKVGTHKTTINHPLREREIFLGRKDIIKRLLPDIIAPVGERLKRPESVDNFLTDTAKLYKTAIVQNSGLKWISRKEIYSDCLDFIIKYVFLCESAVYLDKPLYYYRRTNVDSQTAQYRPNTLNLWLVQFETLRDFIQQHELFGLWEAYYSRICFSIIPIGGNAYRMGNYRLAMKEIKEALSQPVYREAFQNFDISKLSLHFRPLFFFAKHRMYVPFYLMTAIMRMMMNKQRNL